MIATIRYLLPGNEKPVYYAASRGGADARLERRFAIVNVWRSIAGPVLNSPLALCDASTIAPADLVASEWRAEDRIGELELAPPDAPARESMESRLLVFF